MFLQWKCYRDNEGHEAGRGLLAQMYYEKTGNRLPPIAVTERGKPYFVDGGLHFSFLYLYFITDFDYLKFHNIYLHHRLHIHL